MDNTYDNLIGDVDRLLKIERALLLNGAEKERANARKAIDRLLDERLILMKTRDMLNKLDK